MKNEKLKKKKKISTKNHNSKIVNKFENLAKFQKIFFSSSFLNLFFIFFCWKNAILLVFQF